MVLWIFGYGSLIWTPDFHYEERVSGYVKNYRRAFAQVGPEDERTGTVELNLTLEAQDGEITGGVAYRVSEEVEEQILSSGMSSPDSSVALMLDFFAPGESKKPAVSGVLTYIVPPESSNLWYIGLSKMVPVKPAKVSRRSTSGLELFSKAEPRTSQRTRRESKRERCRDRVSYESESCSVRQ